MSTALDPIFSGLNEEQRKAVETVSGPVLILAGAGSGKTRALTHRIAFLISQGVAPWQILAVTFTNKAANEMKHRIKALLHITEGEDLMEFNNHAAKLPVMGTFHSVCVRMLRKDIQAIGRDRNFVIYDSDDQEKLMKQVLKEMHIDESELKPRAALGYIGRFKCEALSPASAQEQATTPHLQQAIRVYDVYQKSLRRANALDFDDLILETVRLLTEVPEVLARYHNTWKYLHIDEYQDTNHAQYLLISLLAQKEGNLCVIGDPDQSIYAFRGADIRNILEFKKEYPSCAEIKLEQNYRSTQLVLDAADKVISHNPNRPKKKMWTERKEGPAIVVQEVRDERAEADEAIKAAQQLHRTGLALREQVILYRTNAQSRLFEEACLRTGTPYRIIGGVKFYARKEVKDVLAYLYVLLNPQDTLSLLRIINVPARKIGDVSIAKLQAFCAERKVTLYEALGIVDEIMDLQEPLRERLRGLRSLLDTYRAKSTQEPVSQVMQELVEAINLEDWLKDDTEEGETRWQNVLELQSVAHKYDALEPSLSLSSFLEEVALVSEVDKLQDAGADALTLMTLHLCKGLEFEHVMVVGCEEGIFPHSNSQYDQAQLEEERRLMYVGMTRAKTHLKLFCARKRMLYGETKSNPPSRFLDDLPDTVERRSDELLSAFAWAGAKGQERVWGMGGNRSSSQRVQPFRQGEVNMEFNQDVGAEDLDQSALTFETGDRVVHPTFGEGVIVERRGEVVDIAFDNGKRKTLALSIAPLRKV